VHVPLSLDVAGRRVVVVGDGGAADRRAASLTEAGAVVDQVAGHRYDAGVLAGAWLVVTAAGAEVNDRVYADAETAGIWCNAVDDPAHCSYLFPSVLRRGGVTVAVSTGGQSPSLAAWLRRQLEDAVGPEFAEVALRLADERRRIHAAGGSTEGYDWSARIEEHRRRCQAGVPSSSNR
jgi:siroheme synthase-like protein